tara:strand:+ start:117561 stop:118697 length:1137 start_codon:yes stop_codon:yes gene_type:complete
MLLSIDTYAQSPDYSKAKVIAIIGDSWAGFPCLFNSFDKELEKKKKPYQKNPWESPVDLNTLSSIEPTEDVDTMKDELDPEEEFKLSVQGDPARFNAPEDYQSLLNSKLSMMDQAHDNEKELIQQIELGGVLRNRPPYRRVKRPAHVVGCSSTAIMGAETTDWFEDKKQKKIKKLLNNYKNTLKVIYLSTGGNDLMRRWNKNMTIAEEVELMEKVYQDIRRLVMQFKELVPGVKVYISGYDFPNFEDGDLILGYKDLFKAMGTPRPEHLNYGLMRFSEYMTKIQEIPGVVYQHHMGLSHYHFGMRGLFGKKETLHPMLISHPLNPIRSGGDPLLPTNKKAMFHIFDWYFDPFHLRPKAYRYIIRHAYKSYIHHWLYND